MIHILDEESDIMKNRLSLLTNKFQIKDLLTQKASTLSGGEKQRVSLVRALMLNPKLIICVEPTKSLDDDNKIIILNYLKILASLGCAKLLFLMIPVLKRFLIKNIFLRIRSWRKYDSFQKMYN